MDYPTPETIDQWDDASLFTSAGCESALRFHRDGFESLNDAEQSLCCLYLLEAEVNNGGFGQWIYSLCPASAAESPRVLRRIGANEMASCIADVLLLMGDVTRITSREQWIDHYLALPDDVQDYLGPLTRRFLELEDVLLELAYAYTRTHWQNVRVS